MLTAFFPVRRSAAPADDGHAFEHGKHASVSGLIEPVLILGAALLIIRQAPGKMVYPGREGMDRTLMMAGPGMISSITG